MKLTNFKKAFVLAPHPDDGELGCGGTISKLLNNGVEVFYITFSLCQESVPDGFPKNQLEFEVKKATKVLGIKEENVIIFDFQVRKFNYSRQEILEKLISLRTKYDPDLIFIPSLNDLHQDHSTIANEGLRAFKNKTVLAYELIWNNLNFNNQCFMILDKNNVDIKIAALKEYKTQHKRIYINKEFIYSLAIVRGVQISEKYAETFEVIRWIIKE
ncbi:PIG-L family deacetylase [bacterium]|nr:PIG-L family deacetylase [bacterium]|tara:strand:- start:6387 stop:7031 length:645 start_codon:yes stop_codon:yes gene_type:complete